MSKMQYYFDQCDPRLMSEIKNSIQESINEMIEGSSTLIRLLFYLSKNSDESTKKFQDLLMNGKLFCWSSTLQNLVSKVRNHFVTLRKLLFDFMNADSQTDYEKGIQSISDDFDKAIDYVCPVENQLEKRKFFITSICEQTGTFLAQHEECFSSDDEDMKRNGLIRKSRREDGKGIHVVSQSIAASSNRQKYFEIQGFETKIVNSGYISCIDALSKTSLLIGTSIGEVYNLEWDESIQEFRPTKIYGRKDDMVWTVNHLNESNIIIFFNTGELKLIQIDNNNMKTLGKVSNKPNEKTTKGFGKLVKLNSSRTTIYWKRSNQEIIRHDFETNIKPKVKQSIEYNIKDKNDYIIDFDIDERNDSLYALSHLGKIYRRDFRRNSSCNGTICIDNERASNKHFSSCIRISRDNRFMVVGSFQGGSYESLIMIQLFELMENEPSSPIIKSLNYKEIKTEKQEKNDEYIQAIDFNMHKGDQLFLSVFLRYSCKILVFRIVDKSIEGPVFEKPLETEWINDISYVDNSLFTCFESNTLGKVFFNEEVDDV